jgi:class 3 adenylate cyclase/YHS domain-containing protein
LEKDLAILISDLSGYTALTEIHGGTSASEIVDRYVELVNESLIGKSYLAERIGDQVMVCSVDVDDLAETAIRLNELTRNENFFLPIHAGLHYGKIIEKNGHLFGSTINTTARIASVANSGQVLCSEFFADHLRNRSSFKLTDQGIFQFKNIMRRIRLFELFSSSPVHQFLLRDPVCHMLIVSPNEKLVCTHQGKVFHFCSQHCMDLFRDSHAGREGSL